MSKKVTFMHRKNYKNPINTTVRIAFLIEDCHHLFQTNNIHVKKSDFYAQKKL